MIKILNNTQFSCNNAISFSDDEFISIESKICSDRTRHGCGTLYYVCLNINGHEFGRLDLGNRARPTEDEIGTTGAVISSLTTLISKFREFNSKEKGYLLSIEISLDFDMKVKCIEVPTTVAEMEAYVAKFMSAV